MRRPANNQSGSSQTYAVQSPASRSCVEARYNKRSNRFHIVRIRPVNEKLALLYLDDMTMCLTFRTSLRCRRFACTRILRSASDR